MVLPLIGGPKGLGNGLGLKIASRLPAFTPLAHKCRVWWRQGLHCPFGPLDDHEADEVGDDVDDAPPTRLLVPARRAERQRMLEDVGNVVGETESAAIMARATQTVEEMAPVGAEGLGEEAVARESRDRIFNPIPDLPFLPIPGLRPRAGGAFMFNSFKRLQFLLGGADLPDQGRAAASQSGGGPGGT